MKIFADVSLAQFASFGTETEIDVTDNPHQVSDTPFLYLMQVRSLIKANDQIFYLPSMAASVIIHLHFFHRHSDSPSTFDFAGQCNHQSQSSRASY